MHKVTASNISFVISAAVTLLVWLFIHLSREWLSAPFDLHAEFTNLINPFDSTSQRIGHLIFVTLIGIFAIGIAVFTKFSPLTLPLVMSPRLSQVVAVIERPHYVLVWAFILIVFSWRWYGNVIPIFFSIFFIVTTAYILKNIEKKISNLFFLFLTLGLIFYHLILPLLLPLDFSNFNLTKYVFHLETHYSIVLGAAERLIQGGTPLNNVAIIDPRNIPL